MHSARVSPLCQPCTRCMGLKTLLGRAYLGYEARGIEVTVTPSPTKKKLEFVPFTLDSGRWKAVEMSNCSIFFILATPLIASVKRVGRRR